MKQEFSAVPPTTASPPVNERHYTVREVAETWSMSENLVRRLFENEPGVVIFKRTDPTNEPIRPSEFQRVFYYAFTGETAS